MTIESDGDSNGNCVAFTTMVGVRITMVECKESCGTGPDKTLAKVLSALAARGRSITATLLLLLLLSF